jgi:hypothetical protein
MKIQDREDKRFYCKKKIILEKQSTFIETKEIKKHRKKGSSL